MRPADAVDQVVDDLTRRILSSAKYRSLDEALVRRVATDAAQRFSTAGDALKYAKRKLHQSFGAFLSRSPAPSVSAVVACDPANRRAAALDAMAGHASSAERVPWLTPFYDQVSEWCGEPVSVADLACGLNPLAIPWMHLAPQASYWACEMDGRLVEALGQLGPVLPVQLTAEVRDLVAEPPAVQAEVTLLLKAVTTLEQQAKGAASRVIRAVTSPHVILSLPRGSLSGRRSYGDDPDRIVATALSGSRYAATDHATFGSEIVYHLEIAGEGQ